MAKWEVYETEKRKLKVLNLTSVEYEKAIRKLLIRLKL